MKLINLISAFLLVFVLSCKKNNCDTCTADPRFPINSFSGRDCNSKSRLKINARLVPLGNLSLARRGMGIATAGNKIFFAGGFDDHDFTSSMDIYDITSNSWTITSLSEKKGFITTAVSGNKIFFAGGDLGYIYSSKVEMYDAGTNIWEI